MIRTMCEKNERIEDYRELHRMFLNWQKICEGNCPSVRWQLPKSVLEKGIPYPGLRQALGFKHAIEMSDILISAEELIVGTRPVLLSDPEKLKEWQGGSASYTGGITAHMAISYDNLLREGYEGVRRRLVEKLERLKKETSLMYAQKTDELTSTIDSDAFYREDFLEAGLICIDAAMAYQQRYLDAAKKLLNETQDADLRRNVERQIELLSRVPTRGATTFHEALQSIYFTSVLTTTDAGLMGLGRLDQVLWPMYQRDVEKGILTPERAVELLGGFFIKLSQLIWVPMSIMLGGKTRDGKNAVNDLTRLMLRAGNLVRLHNPSLGIAVNDETPEDVLELGSQMVVSGYGHPAFFNDTVITDGLIKYGVKEEDARWHLHCTCTEITPSGCSGIWVVADYMNFPKVIEKILSGKFADETGESGVAQMRAKEVQIKPEMIGSFDQLLDMVKRGLAEIVRNNCRWMNAYARTRQAQGAFPFLSLFVNDCLEKELDLERGGAKYYFFYPQLVGLPTVVDSLMAIKTVVFDEKKMGFPEFAKIVNANFEGSPELREYIIERVPKYGTNQAQVDTLAKELIDFYCKEVYRYTNPYGFRFVPGFLSWIMHAILGKDTGATPDGRLAGQALSDSLAAVQGRAKRGPTAMLDTVEKFDLGKAIGAVVVNVTIPLGQPDKKIVSAVKDMIKAHFARGGFELQFNVMSKEKLEAAKKEPEKYRDLLVRVGGYSDYFVNLDATIQEEIIRRFE